MSVTEAAALIQRAVVGSLPSRLVVVGQVSNFADRTHWFFTIKDADAALRCVMFASATRRQDQLPIGDGMLVEATGCVDFYTSQGQLQFYVESVVPAGEGVLERNFRLLCDGLRRDGYFDPARKRPLPLVPRGIAVITSRHGAAWQDVLDTARRRWPGCALTLLDVRVQGENAAAEIADALNRASRRAVDLGIDVIVLTRGGGSIEDLWAFNERAVADAVFACQVPVVAAIGHESDTTVAELVADQRSATPTQAVMRVVPDAEALSLQVRQIRRRLDGLVAQWLQQAKDRLSATASRPLYRRPSQLLIPLRLQLDRGIERAGASRRHALASARLKLREAEQQLPRIDPSHLLRLARQRFMAARQRLQDHLPRLLHERARRLEAAARHLGAVGPTHVLRRGFSYTEGPGGQLISSVRQVPLSGIVTTTVADGRFQSQVLRGNGAKPLRHDRKGDRAPGLFDGDAPPPGM